MPRGIVMLLAASAMVSLLAVPACAGTVDMLHPSNTTQYFDYSLHPTLYGSEQYAVGQDVRVVIRAEQNRLNSLFNRTTRGELRVRVQSAYANATVGSGYMVSCNSTRGDAKIWAEVADFGTTRTIGFGDDMVMEASLTVSAPPFPFRVCFKYTPQHLDDNHHLGPTYHLDGQWVSGTYSDGRTVHSVNESSVYYYTPEVGSLNEGDYAAIAISRRSTAFVHTQTVPNPILPNLGDTVKLVPAGYPCTYERPDSRDNSTAVDYCGTNLVRRRNAGYTGSEEGEWVSDHCRKEGSVTNGVGLVGTNWMNPLVSTTTQEGFPRAINANETLVAYFKLPEAGEYDVCYSPIDYRRRVSRLLSEYAAPLWFKLIQANNTCADDRHTVYTDPMACAPNRNARLVINPRHTDAPSWSMPYAPIAGTWVTMKVSGTELNTYPATKFDMPCTTGLHCDEFREYYRTVGGDVLRLVPRSVIDTADTAGTPGQLRSRTVTGDQQRMLVTRAAGHNFGSEKTELEQLAEPDAGTVASSAGCWSSTDDNYGSHRGLSAQYPHLCTTTSCTDANSAGVTASSDLGAEPHSNSSAADADIMGVTAAYAYLRLPRDGSFFVCYRRAGTASWQVLEWDAAETIPSSRLVDTTGNYTVFHVDGARQFTNVSYHLNDTRAMTWAPFEVRKTEGGLTTQAWNYYNVTTDAETVGTAFRLVSNLDGCDTPSPHVELTDPGLHECVSPTETASCTEGSSCSNCHGRLDTSTTSRLSIVFHTMIPYITDSSQSHWRVCLRDGAGPWVEIPRNVPFGDPYALSPQLAPQFRYTLADRGIGSWGRIRLWSTDESHTGSFFDTYPFDGVFGTIVRLAPNRSTCDVTWTGTGVGSDYNSTFITTDLAGECTQTTAAAGSCNGRDLNPQAGGINASFPYVLLDTRDNRRFQTMASAFLTLPEVPSASMGFTLCIKQGHLNWVPVAPSFRTTTPASAAQLVARGTSHVYYAGAYDYVELSATSGSIDVEHGVVKMVEGTSTCDRAAVGSSTVYERQYESTTMASAYGAAFVHATDITVTTGTTSLARAYFTMPSTNDTEFSGDTTYRVCFLPAMSATVNWFDLGSVTVRSVAIGWTAHRKLYNSGTFRITVRAAGSVSLNTSRNGDSLKIVPQASPCAANASLPSTLSSDHVGTRSTDIGVTSVADEGITNLGPSDLVITTLAEGIDTLPVAAGNQRYRVCYRPFAISSWIELPEVSVEFRVATIGTGGVFLSLDSGVTSATIGDEVLFRAPAPGIDVIGTESNISFWSSAVAGASTTFTTTSVDSSATASTTNYFTVTGTTLSSSDSLSLVLVARQRNLGAYDLTGAGTCDEGEVVVSVTADSSSTAGSATFTFDLPLTPGKYLLCYTPAANPGAMVVLPLATGNATNPLTVLEPQLYVTVDTTSNAIQAKELPSALYPDALLGSLSVTDYFYFTNLTDSACGQTLAPLNVSAVFDGLNPVDPPNGEVHTIGTVYNVLDVRDSATVLSTSQLPANTYAACYYKSVDNATVAGEFESVTKAGGWYRVPVFTNNAFQQIYRSGGGPTKLWAQCVKNATAGVPFDISVTVLDADNRLAPQASAAPLEITASTGSGSWNFENTGGQCTPDTAPVFGVAASNPTIYTTTGEATFRVNVLSGCGSSGYCPLSFTSPGLTSSNECLVRVRETPLASIVAETVPSSCFVNASCAITFLARTSDGSIAFTYSGSAWLQIPARSGLRYTSTSATSTTTTAAGTGMLVAFVNGRATLDIVPMIDESTVASWFESVGNYAVTMTLYNASSLDTSAVSVDAAVVVVRPSLAQLAIDDLWRTNWDGSDPSDSASMRNPDWEASDTFSAFWNSSADSPSITSTTFPLVAGQYYTVRLRALDSRGVLLPSSNLIPSTSTITLIFQDTAATSGNVIIGAPSTLADSYSYSVPLSQIAFNGVSATVRFRLKTATGCLKSVGGCRIAILVGGRALNPPAFIQSVVRAPATKLVASCGVATSATTTLPANLTVGECPSTTVHGGAFLQIEAQDGFGIRDDFFSGTIYAVMGSTVEDQSGIPDDVRPSRVSAISTGQTWTSATISDGLLRINDFTLTKVCPTQPCNVTFFSDLAAGHATLAMTLVKDTTKITCSVNASRGYYVKSTDGTEISARYTSGLIAQQGRLLVYPDTDLCFVVSAADESQQRTLYESIWAHWSARSPSGLPITASPSTLTPTRYRYMTRSQVEFCMRVDAATGSDFVVEFVAQVFGTNWASGTGGRCVTPTFTVSTRRFIGQLQLVGVSGLTELSAFRAPTSGTAWGYNQLSTTGESFSVIARFGIFDHYGNAISSSNVAASHNGFALTVGTCLPSDMTLGTCAQSTAATATRSIAVTTPHTTAEGGMLRVAITAADTAVTSNGELSVQLSVSQWCLSCSISFRISSASGAYTDGANGVLQNVLRISVLIPNSVPTYVAFQTGNSPMMPPSLDRSGLLLSHWPHFVNSSGARPVSIGSTPVLVHRDCFASGTACPVTDALFSHALCSSDTPTMLTGTGGAPMSFYVVRSTAALRFGEVWCTGDCDFQAGTIQAQADIFNSYDVSVSVGGVQQLHCANSWCVGEATTRVTRSLTALGTTTEAALIAAHNNGLSRASFTLAGLNNSAAYLQDFDTHVVPAGTTPTLAGQLSVSAAAVSASVTAPATLTSSHSLGDDSGEYLLVWRGPQRVGSIAILDVARAPECLNSSTYDFYTVPGGGSGVDSYNGYLTQENLAAVAFDYSTTTVQANTFFPVTVELLDENGNLAPGITGTLLFSKYSWVGCRSGGTMTVRDSADGRVTIANGRATVWLSFSEPCAACRFSVTGTHSASQTDLFGDLAFDDIKRQIVSKPVDVRNSIAGSATTVFGTNMADITATSISVTDTVTAAAAPYARMGKFAYLDSTATVEIAAYNTISASADIGQTLFTVGNGGILRTQGTTAVFGDRHGVRARGVGAASVSFAFQRTCTSCTITIAWTVINTGARGSYTLRAAGGATVFSVAAPRAAPVLVGYAPGTVRKYVAFTLTAWTATSAPGLAFTGFRTSQVPAAAQPTMSLVTDGNGDGGQLDSDVLTTTRSVIYHLRATASCDLCQFSVAGVTHRAVIATTATHYRIQSMTPRLIALDSPVTIEAYASDDEGFVDVTVGGQADCQYVDAFFCDQNALRLAVAASESGRVAGDFYPTNAFMTRGGPSQTSFAIEGGSNFLVTNGRTPDGGTTLVVSGSPVSKCIPIVSDATGRSSASYPTFAMSTDLGLSGLVLMNDRPGADAPILEPFTVLVAFTKQTSASSARFIVSNADNTIRVDPAGECNYRLLNPSIFVKMVDGIANFTFMFLSKSVGGTCTPVFSVVTGNGQCETPAECSSQADIRAYEVEATSWDFSRPSDFENDLPGVVGPRYAVAGRTQLLNPQLLQISTTQTINAMSCRAGCVVSVTSLSCSPAPTISPSGGTSFNSNGTASISASWPILQTGSGVNVTRESYSCELIGSATGGVDPPAVTTFTVQVCNPTRIQLLTNNSASSWTVGTLETSKSYSLDVEMLDNNGQLCRGDTQYGISTVLHAELVDVDGQPVTGMEVININTTTSTAPGEPLQPFNNTAYLAGGRFRYQLVFSDATAAYNLSDGVRVKVTATSVEPVLNVVAFTPAVQVTQRPSTIRWVGAPSLYVSRARTYGVNLLGTDAVPEQWLAQRRQRPFRGNESAAIAIDVNPSFRQVLPLELTGDMTGRGQIAMTAGVANVSFTFKASTADGMYNISFRHPRNVYQPAYDVLPSPRSMILQTPVSYSLLSFEFRTGAPHACNSNCTLPSAAFDESADGSGMLNTTQGRTFDLSVFVADPNGLPVLGETGLSISCRAISSRGSASLVSLAEAPALVNNGTLTRPVVDGYANFSVGMTYSLSGTNGTVPNTTTTLDSEPVQIVCGCTSGQCPPGLPQAATRPLTVQAINITAEIRAALDSLMIIKVPTTSTALSQIDLSLVQSVVLDSWIAGGVNFVDGANKDRAIQVTACLVNRDLFGFSDLYGTVCGPSNACSPLSPTTCPNQVVECSCPNAAAWNRRALASRDTRLFAARQAAAQDIQLEVVISLNRVPGFNPSNVAEVNSMYTRLQTLTVDALSSPTGPLAGIGIIADTILTKNVAEGPATAPPSPPTLPPLTVPPVVNVTRPISAAPAPATVSVALMAALLSVLVMSLFSDVV